MLRSHMSLSQLTAFPVLIKHKVGRIFIVLMQTVLQAAFSSTDDIDQILKLNLYPTNIV